VNQSITFTGNSNNGNDKDKIHNYRHIGFFFNTSREIFIRNLKLKTLKKDWQDWVVLWFFLLLSARAKVVPDPLRRPDSRPAFLHPEK
jgi:hypothetical protein